MAKAAYLILADGTIYEGTSFGAEGTAVGELVCTTSMTGYQETLTDPSYFGQLITQTFPLIGNYGVNSYDGESPKVWSRGYVVREYCEHPSNFRCERTIDAYLKEQGVVGISGLDTRALTRKIRRFGVINSAITTRMPEDLSAFLDEIRAFQITDAVKTVSTRVRKFYASEGNRYTVVLYDYGYKKNILQSLLKRGCNVVVVPYNTPCEVAMDYQPDGFMLSNGPGNPKENQEAIAVLKEIMQTGKPIFGICLGHQLLALANGAGTEKLLYGHRGSNQPVVDLEMDRVFITSQNHGYMVVGDSLPPEVGTVSHINGNDKSCEGIVYKSCNAFTVQFHPEACGGPLDTQYLFDKFTAMMDREGR